MRWVVKMTDRVDEPKHMGHLVLDDDLRDNPVLRGISPEEAERLVATGEWKYVLDDRPH